MFFFIPLQVFGFKILLLAVHWGTILITNRVFVFYIRYKTHHIVLGDFSYRKRYPMKPIPFDWTISFIGQQVEKKNLQTLFSSYAFLVVNHTRYNTLLNSFKSSSVCPLCFHIHSMKRRNNNFNSVKLLPGVGNANKVLNWNFSSAHEWPALLEPPCVSSPCF